MTLVEVLVAMLVMSISLLSLLACLLQSRRVSENSINSNTAAVIVQSFMEQLKSMPLSDMANLANGGPNTSYSIPTQSDQNTADPLQTTSGTPPAMSTLTPGQTPTGVVDNLKDVPNQNGGTNTGVAQVWSGTTGVWPGAQTYAYSTGTPYSGDFYLNMWVWITDLSGTTPNAASVYGITIIYTWQTRDGKKARYYMDEIRSIRSSVPSF